MSDPKPAFGQLFARSLGVLLLAAAFPALVLTFYPAAMWIFGPTLLVGFILSLVTMMAGMMRGDGWGVVWLFSIPLLTEAFSVFSSGMYLIVMRIL